MSKNIDKSLIINYTIFANDSQISCFERFIMSNYQTTQRKKLFTVFSNNVHKTFSAQDLYELLKNENISLSAIYRNLTAMEKNQQIVKVLDKNRKENCYQYFDKAQCSDIIHLKCKICAVTLHTLTDFFFL